MKIPRDKILNNPSALRVTGQYDLALDQWRRKMAAIIQSFDRCKTELTVQSIIDANRAAIIGRNLFNTMASSGMTAANIGTALNNFFSVPDWSVYEPEYNALREPNGSLDAYIAEATAEQTSIQDTGTGNTAGQMIWAELGDTTTIEGLVDTVLAHFTPKT